jgi:peroxiredoxin Q/BCP
MPLREVGHHYPDFVLSCHDMGMVKLSRTVDRNDFTVLVFFLVAGSPGCTRQLNGYRDLYSEFRRHKTAVVGVSPDTVANLAEFVKNNNIPFDLCSDMDHRIAEEWGCYSEGGQMRSTFIINNRGTVVHVVPRANVYSNAREIFQWILDHENEEPMMPYQPGLFLGVTPRPDPPPDPPAAEAPAPAPAAAAAPPVPPTPIAAPVATPAPVVVTAQPAPVPIAAPAPVPIAAPAPPPQAPVYAAPIAAAPVAAPAPAGPLSATDVIVAFGRTSLQLLLAHAEAGGQLPPDLLDLAGRLALLRFAR